MIEPPQPGFTGVVWEAREPDRLTRELFTGPGAVPMAEAGAAWARLAVGFGTAVVEYEQIIAELRGAWQSDTSGPVLDRVSRLRDWLADAAVAAGTNATRAEGQAAAHELARLTMPHTAEIAALQAAQRMLEQITGALGAPLRAVAAETDAQADLAKAAATRVMRTYESATEPLATPWVQQEPPVIATDAALAAEQAATPAAAAGGSASAVPSGGIPATFTPGMLGSIAVPSRVPSAYRTPVLAQSAEPVESVAPQPVQTSAAAPMPIVPGAMAAGAPVLPQGEEEHTPRAGDAGVDALGADLGIVSAPAVLGAPEPPTSTAPSARTEAGGGT